MCPLTCCLHCSPSCSSSVSTTSRTSSRTGPPSWCVAAAAFQSFFQQRSFDAVCFQRVFVRFCRSASFFCRFAHNALLPPSSSARETPFSLPVFKPHSRLSSLTMSTPSSLLCGCPPSAASKLLSSSTPRAPCGQLIIPPCRCDVPYCIVKSKARLGKLVNQKTVTAVAVTAVEKADEGKGMLSILHVAFHHCRVHRVSRAASPLAQLSLCRQVRQDDRHHQDQLPREVLHAMSRCLLNSRELNPFPSDSTRSAGTGVAVFSA